MVQLHTPVLFLVFNRPDCTARVFAEIRRVQPSQLFVVADGPRTNRPEDAQNCAAVRTIIDNGVDWDCQVCTLYAEENMGCAKRVSSGITWFFEQVEEGIVLEDDCLPDSSFFPFCQELLAKYRNDTRVMQICGFNRLGTFQEIDESYCFSKYGPIWGWASWERAWKSYDIDMKLWPEVKQSKRYEFFCDNKEEIKWRYNLFESMYSKKIDTWDFQWVFAKLLNTGLCVVPKANLVRNIGFGKDATHTINIKHEMSFKCYGMDFPLKHPGFVLRNKRFDELYFKSCKQQRVISRLIRLLIKRIIT